VSCSLRTLSSFIAEQNLDRIDLLKIDCEGAEWSAIQGIEDADWSKIKSLVIEVHDTDGRLNKVKDLLTEKGFNRLHAESESGLESTAMFNLFALRL